MCRCHTKSVITKPQNVYVMRDIMCTGYVAGGNCRFFGCRKDNEFAPNTSEEERIAKIREDINKRLSFHDEVSGEYASMLAFISPYSDVTGGYRDQVISLSERLLPWEVTRHTTNTQKDYFPGGPMGFSYYKDQIGLNQLHFGEDVRAVENMEFISQARKHSNTVLRPSTWRVDVKLTTACVLSCAGLRQQRAVLHRPTPPLQPVL